MNEDGIGIFFFVMPDKYKSVGYKHHINIYNLNLLFITGNGI